MHEIYRSAENVLVWLGEGESGTARALDLCGRLSELTERKGIDEALEQTHQTADLDCLGHADLQTLAKVLHQDEEIQLTPVTFESQNLPPFSSILWHDFSDLFANPWLERIWTFQEVMLAKRASVRYGAVAIPWASFYDTGMRLSHTKLLFHPDVLRQKGSGRRMTRLRSFMYPPGGGEHFWLHVSEGRHKKVTEPADRIYGMLSLASEEVRREIPVDYSSVALADYSIVYKQATKAMMKHFGASHILQLVDTSQINPSLPSWCPHFELVSDDNGSVWCDGRAGFYAASTQQIFEQCLDDSSISVGGFVVDEVQTVLDQFDWQQAGQSNDYTGKLRWFQDIESSMRPVCADEGQVELKSAQCILTFVPGTAQGIRMVCPTFPSQPAQSLRALRKRYKEMSEGVCYDSSSLNESEMALLRPIETHLAKTWKNRVFFTTKKGHCGIASRGITSEDMLCVTVGAAHFCVLRRRLEAFTFVSMAYVHGGMLGEVLRGLPEGSHEMLTVY